MKCPSCGTDNPPSAKACQCGYDLATRKTDLQESLKEQAQSIREEASRSRPSSDVQREEDSKLESTMKCPSCGVESPASTIKCECGFDFVKGKKEREEPALFDYSTKGKSGCD